MIRKITIIALALAPIVAFASLLSWALPSQSGWLSFVVGGIYGYTGAWRWVANRIARAWKPA